MSNGKLGHTVRGREKVNIAELDDNHIQMLKMREKIFILNKDDKLSAIETLRNHSSPHLPPQSWTPLL